VYNDSIVNAHSETGAMNLLFTTVAHRILQMCSENCINDNQLLEIENEKDKIFKN